MPKVVIEKIWSPLEPRAESIRRSKNDTPSSEIDFVDHGLSSKIDFVDHGLFIRN
jgi:hypothetical protein